MKDQFTPGPWEVVTHYNRERLLDDQTGATFSVVKPVDGSFPEDNICEVWGTEHDDSANARLIAQAPAMYEALKKLANEAAGFLGMSDVERHGQTNSRVLRDRIEQARDLLAKVEGEPLKELSTLSDEDLSRLIAEFLEPMPEVEYSYDESKDGKWLLHRVVKIEGRFTYQWQPRDMVNDPAMTVMLIGKLEWPELTRYRSGPEASNPDTGWIVVPHWDNPRKYAIAASIGRAVAEAFALANNLK